MISSDEDSISNSGDSEKSERIEKRSLTVSKKELTNPYPKESQTQLDSLQSFAHLEIDKDAYMSPSPKRESEEGSFSEGSKRDIEILSVTNADLEPPVEKFSGYSARLLFTNKENKEMQPMCSRPVVKPKNLSRHSVNSVTSVEDSPHLRGGYESISESNLEDNEDSSFNWTEKVASEKLKQNKIPASEEK